MRIHRGSVGSALVSPGTWPARVVGTEERTSRKGTPMVVLRLLVEAPEGDSLLVCYLPCGSFDERWVSALEAIGLHDQAQAFDRGEDVEIEAEWWSGASVRAVVEMGEYNGEPRSEVVALAAPASGPATPPASGVGADEVPF